MRFIRAWAWSAAIALLAGCAPVTVQTYSGPPKGPSQIAALKGVASEAPGTGRMYYLFFSSYSEFDPPRKPAFKSVGDSFTGYPKELTMLPGRYLVMTRCSTGNQYAFPAFTMTVAAGAEYEVQCGPVPDQLNRVRVLVRQVRGPQGPQDSRSGDKLEDLLPLLK